MSRILNQHEIVNAFCNVHNLTLSREARAALANLIFEVAARSYENGVAELSPYKGALRGACPELHDRITQEQKDNSARLPK